MQMKMHERFYPVFARNKDWLKGSGLVT